MKLSVSKWCTFAGKEITENLRSKNIFALACVFIFLALLSVLTARFMGEIMDWALSIEGGAGLMMEIPDPVWTDSYVQLYSNLTSMGMLAFVMIYMGAILREKRSGTIDLMMAKGLTPTVFVVAKYAVAVAVSILALVVTVLITYVYTLVLFEYGGNIGHVLLGAVPFGVFMIMMLGITIMWSAIAKSTAMSAVLGLVSFFLFIPLDLIPWIGRFTPGRLLGHGVSLSVGVGAGNYLGIQIAVAIVVTIVALWIAIQVLRKREG